MKPLGSIGWIGASLVVVVLGFGLLQVAGASPPDPAPREDVDQGPLVEVAPVEAMTDGFPVTGQGFVRPSAEMAVVSEVTGRVLEVADNLRVGMSVREGEMLLRIDPEPFVADVRRAEADVAAARAQLALADVQLSRQTELVSRGVASQAVLDQARATRDQAAALVAQARAALSTARIRLDDTTITAPFDARVASEAAAVGGFLSPGQEIARLFATDYAEIEVGLSQDAVAFLPPMVEDGLPAMVRAAGPGGERAFEARLARIDPELDPRARTIDVIVHVQDAFAESPERRALLVGEFVEVEFQGRARQDVVSVPEAAVFADGRVYRLGEENRLAEQGVQVAGRRDGAVFVVGGALSAGDQVLVTDLPNPSDGDRVRVADAAAG